MLQTSLIWLLAPSALTPHGFCLLWEPWLIWASVIGDCGTGLAYFGIPLALARFVHRRHDLAFKPVFWLFAAFILLCGTTHWLELLTIWVPAYRLEAVAKLTTAAVSVATMIGLWQLLPEALALPSPAQMRTANQALTASEANLRALNVSLETKVEERTAELRASEAHLRDLLATFELGTSITRNLDGTIRSWSEGCKRLYGWTFEEAIGRNLHDLLQTTFPGSRQAVETVLQQEGHWSGDLRHRARDGHEVIVTSHQVLRRDTEGRPIAVLEALTDVTGARRAEHQQRRSDTLLRAIIAVAPGLIYAKDRQSRMLLANSLVSVVVGKPWAEIQGRTDMEFLDDPAQAEAVLAHDREVMEQGRTQEVEELVGTEGGQARLWLSTKTPLRGADGQVEGLVGVSVDITERKRAENRLRLMVHELNHRVKNTLATVQSIAAQTLRSADPAVRQVLEDRLHALAGAHDVLTSERWEGADLHDVVVAVLAPHGGAQAGRFRVAGPPVRLLPKAALALAMGLHELATNAREYGALSPDAAGGQVSLIWSTRHGRLRLVWSEQGGPPVTRPLRKGFGTRLVERSLAQDLGGKVAIAFRPGGVICTLDAPLVDAAAHAEVPPLPQVGSVGARGVTQGLRGLRVLLVEDEAIVSMLIEEYLEELGCTLAGVASRLKQALALADSLPLDAAVLDVNLAGELSYPVAELLRLRNVPFVFVSGYGVTGLPETLRTSPALAKPFRPMQLAQALQAARGG